MCGIEKEDFEEIALKAIHEKEMEENNAESSLFKDHVDE